MIHPKQSSKCLALLTFWVGLGLLQTAFVTTPKNDSEKILCESLSFEQDANGRIHSSKSANSNGKHLILRFRQIATSAKNREVHMSLTRGAFKSKSPRHFTSSRSKNSKSLHLETRFAAVPVFEVPDPKEAYNVVTARYGLTKVTAVNEAALFNDEYAPSILNDMPHAFAYYLTLRWNERGANFDRGVPHLVDGVLTSAKNQSPISLKFRCVVRGI